MTEGSGPPENDPPGWAAPGGQPPSSQPGWQPPPYPPQYQAQPYTRPPAPRPGVIPLRPLGLGDILDGTFTLIRAHPRTTLGLSAVIAAIAAVPVAVGQAFSFTSLGGVLDDPASTPTMSTGGIVASVGSSVLGLVMTFVGTIILTGILTRVLGRAIFGGRITAGEAWRMTRPRLLALLGLVLLNALIVLAPALIVVGLAAALITADAGLGVTIPVIGLAVVLYVVYAVFMATRLALGAPALVLEGRGVRSALGRSWSLVKGDSWRVFGIILLTQILVGVASFVIAVPFTIAGSAVGYLGGGSVGAGVVAAILAALGGIVSSTITYPFNAGVTGLLYTDRRMRAEAFDLVLQTAAARLEGGVEPSVDDLWPPQNGSAEGSGGPP
ncbi:MAG: glycerophosphoryl diester phosphodiesterase membrane domain-containing protein [Nocardioidaceae bacterium]